MTFISFLYYTDACSYNGKVLGQLMHRSDWSLTGLVVIGALYMQCTL